MKTVPQAFYESPAIQKLLVDGLSAVIYKKVTTADIHNERYLAAHAITLVLKGALKIKPAEHSPFLVQAEQMVFLSKGMYMISDIIPDGAAFEAVVFFFEETLINDFLKQIPSPTLPHLERHSHLLNYTSPLKIFTNSLLKLYAHPPSNSSAITALKLLEFLHLIAQSPQNLSFIHQLLALKNRTKKQLKAFMESHYDKPLNVEDYAYLTGRSLSTFRRDFKRQFTIPPKQWLIEQRLDKALQILKTGQSNVTDTAFAVGYDNVSHFIKAFRKKYGTSPKQFLIQNRQRMLL